MKKIAAVLLTIICFFALTLELSGTDPDKKWSFRSYVEYVTENVEPLPKADLLLDFSESSNFISGGITFVKWLGDVVIYPLKFVGVSVSNCFVILNGFLPFKIEFKKIISDEVNGDYDGNGDGSPDSAGDAYVEPPEIRDEDETTSGD